MIRFAFATLLASSLLATPAAAQTREEQAYAPGGVADISCDVGGFLIGAIFGSGAAETARDIAERVGVCNEERARSTTPPASSTSTPATTPGLEPGLQIRLVAVRPQAEGQPRVEAATPDTSLRVNDGFAAIVSSNAPGLLEIWSVDDRGANFIEAHVLTGPTNIVLPKATAGYYRITSIGGNDRLRFRFRPCRPPNAQAFEPQSNATVAAAVSAQSQAAAQLTGTAAVPICTFSENMVLTQSNGAQFGSATPRTPTFSTASGAYTVTAAGTRAFIADIALKLE